MMSAAFLARSAEAKMSVIALYRGTTGDPAGKKPGLGIKKECEE
ncbi:hypothetical protein THAOC_16756, partial [Thalassiosira oceanica]